VPAQDPVVQGTPPAQRFADVKLSSDDPTTLCRQAPQKDTLAVVHAGGRRRIRWSLDVLVWQESEEIKMHSTGCDAAAQRPPRHL